MKTENVLETGTARIAAKAAAKIAAKIAAGIDAMTDNDDQAEMGAAARIAIAPIPDLTSAAPRSEGSMGLVVVQTGSAAASRPIRRHTERQRRRLTWISFYNAAETEIACDAANRAILGPSVGRVSQAISGSAIMIAIASAKAIAMAIETKEDHQHQLPPRKLEL
jgi:hypothetical protein